MCAAKLEDLQEDKNKDKDTHTQTKTNTKCFQLPRPPYDVLDHALLGVIFFRGKYFSSVNIFQG